MQRAAAVEYVEADIVRSGLGIAYQECLNGDGVPAIGQESAVGAEAQREFERRQGHRCFGHGGVGALRHRGRGQTLHGCRLDANKRASRQKLGMFRPEIDEPRSGNADREFPGGLARREIHGSQALHLAGRKPGLQQNMKGPRRDHRLVRRVQKTDLDRQLLAGAQHILVCDHIEFDGR